MNVIIIEDHALLKSAIVQMIKAFYPEAQVDSYTYPSLALPMLQNRQADLMLVDVEYNNKECGIAFITQYRDLNKNCRYIAYTSHKVNQILKEIKRAGFNAYINKEANENEIAECIAAVLSRGAHLFYESQSYRNQVEALEYEEEKFYSSDYEKLKSLTKTESKALRLIAEENATTNKQLAEKLGVQLNTMKKHLTNIYRKLNVKSKDGVKHFSERNKLGNA